ncbi:hypothetical protein, partial [Arsenophonus apicola]|uniref:hypothetical protein n=1 Tax=Arsenophonus apicola TaxID=2879119 RepID=UPI00387A1541
MQRRRLTPSQKPSFEHHIEEAMSNTAKLLEILTTLIITIGNSAVDKLQDDLEINRERASLRYRYSCSLSPALYVTSIQFTASTSTSNRQSLFSSLKPKLLNRHDA